MEMPFRNILNAPKKNMANRVSFKQKMMSLEVAMASGKRSARRSLAAELGEPDHEKNKKDLASLNAILDQMFAKKWGVEPTTGTILADSPFKWEKVGSEDAGIPEAYSMPSLEVACCTNRTRRQGSMGCSGGQLHHLGLRAGVRGSTPCASVAKPLSDVNTNVTPRTSPVLCKDNNTTPELESSLVGSEYILEQCSSPKPSSELESPESPQSQESSVQSSSSTTSSRKRKAANQTTVDEFFLQKKKACVKRRIMPH